MYRDKSHHEDHPIKPTKHSMKRRCQSHDYSKPGFYMLTIVTAERRPLLGKLVTSPGIYTSLTELGKAIRYVEIKKISEHYPNVEVWRQCMMPDHIHMIVRVKGSMPDGKHLGSVIKGFKSGCNNIYWELTSKSQTGLFEEGYNDRLLFGGEQLKCWKKYLTDNPRRLALKKANPDYFTVIHNMDILGRECQIIGNRFLLNIPDKMDVIVHRVDDDSAYWDKFGKWMDCGERGGVLVSASIHPKEKAVMREAMNRGYSIILLRENGFPELYKPSGEAFDACAEGRLLQISPWGYHFDKRIITRKQCLMLNDLATDIAKASIWI